VQAFWQTWEATSEYVDEWLCGVEVHLHAIANVEALIIGNDVNSVIEVLAVLPNEKLPVACDLA
jgi:hypothetical protein